MPLKTLIIPAAGSGSRLNQDIPKPYLKLGGITILEHTISRFISLDGLAGVVISTSESYQAETERILKDLLPAEISRTTVIGGAERQFSIFNALEKINETELVIVHDAVRPFVTSSQIDACCRAAAETGAAVLGIPVRDTIKEIDRDQFVRTTPSRQFLWQAQTPQVFKKDILMEAYTDAIREGFTGTDDSSLVERLGHKVKMVEGDHSNFKITYPMDLKLAQILIEKEQEGNE